MRNTIRMSLLAAALAGMASLPARANGPAFSVSFSSTSGALTGTTLLAPSRLRIEEQQASGRKPPRHVFQVSFQDDGTNLAGRLQQAIASGDTVVATITFSAPPEPSATLAASAMAMSDGTAVIVPTDPSNGDTYTDAQVSDWYVVDHLTGMKKNRNTVVTLTGISSVGGWDDDDDAPTAGGGEIQIRCKYASLKVERQIDSGLDVTNPNTQP